MQRRAVAMSESSSSSNKSLRNVHRIREFGLEEISLEEDYDILQTVGEGWFARVYLAEHKSTRSELVLKAIYKDAITKKDFFREFHYSFYLGQHRNIITTLEEAFETPDFYVFAQEYTPLGDLTSNVGEVGMGELNAKRVAKQVAAALDYIHSLNLVHRDVKMDNILLFRSDFSRIKLCDFGETRQVGSSVTKRIEWPPYSPPELAALTYDDLYTAAVSQDVWQLGIVVFMCLTGNLPWQKAEAKGDPTYAQYVAWHRRFRTSRTPKYLKYLSSKAQKMFRRILDPRPHKRARASEINKFIDDKWLTKIPERLTDDDGQSVMSMFSFHSSVEEKRRLLFQLTQCGLETNVDRSAKRDRIRNWVQTSVIQEEDEEDYEEDEEEEDGEIITNNQERREELRKKLSDGKSSNSSKTEQKGSGSSTSR